METGDAVFKIRRNPEEVRTARGRNVCLWSRKNWPGPSNK